VTRIVVGERAVVKMKDCKLRHTLACGLVSIGYVFQDVLMRSNLNKMSPVICQDVLQIEGNKASVRPQVHREVVLSSSESSTLLPCIRYPIICSYSL